MSENKQRRSASCVSIAACVAAFLPTACGGGACNIEERCPSCGDACAAERSDASHVVPAPPTCSAGAVEVCNAFDDDCDGRTDEGVWCAEPGGPSGPLTMEPLGLEWEGAPAINALWASGPDDVWAFGVPFDYGESGRGVGLHWDGVSWSVVDVGAEYPIADVWGSGPDDVWAVGDEGVIFRWDGTRWSFFESGTLDDLREVWGSGANDVWVRDDLGRVRRWDGAGWSGAVCDSGYRIVAGWPDGSGGSWLLGRDGVYHRQRSMSGPSGVPGDVWSGAFAGTSPDDVWLFADTAEWPNQLEAWHWDGHAWASTPGDGWNAGISSAWAGSTDDAWAATNDDTTIGDQIVHWDGATWTPAPAAGRCYSHRLAGVPGGDPWLACTRRVGELLAAPVVFRWNGTYWQNAMGVDSVDFEAVWGIGGHVWAVGRASPACEGAPTVFERLGERWTPVAGTAGLDLRDLWGAAEDDVWAVGNASHLRWNGTAWTPQTLPVRALLLSVHGVAANDVWAVGQTIDSLSGLALHWDGTAWTVHDLGVAYLLLRDVFAVATDDVWAVGSVGADALAPAGATWHWDGTAWSEVASTASVPLAGVWGFASDDVWAVGWCGQILHWDGSAWESVDGAGECGLNDLWAAGPGELWAVGDSGCVLHGTVAGWAPVPRANGWDALRSVWGSSASEIHAVGYDGAVQQRLE